MTYLFLMMMRIDTKLVFLIYYCVFKSIWGEFYKELQHETLELVALGYVECFYKVSCQTPGDH